MKMSKHAKKRCQQRSLPQETLEIVMRHGRMSHAPAGVCKFFFGNKEYSQAISDLKRVMKTLERARGGTIIMGTDQVVTVYKQH